MVRKWLISHLGLMVCFFFSFFFSSVGEVSRVNEKPIEGLGRCRSTNPYTLL